MPFRKSPSMDQHGVRHMAEGWGKIVARRVHEEVGPELDLDADAVIPGHLCVTHPDSPILTVTA